MIDFMAFICFDLLDDVPYFVLFLYSVYVSCVDDLRTRRISHRPKKRTTGRDDNEDEHVAPRNRDDADFIDNEDDDKELLAEYDGDAPPPGSDSEAEEDNTKEHISSKGTAMMDEILRSMRPSTAQVLSQTGRESLAQDLLQVRSIQFNPNTLK